MSSKKFNDKFKHYIRINEPILLTKKYLNESKKFFININIEKFIYNIFFIILSLILFYFISLFVDKKITFVSLSIMVFSSFFILMVVINLILISVDLINKFAFNYQKKYLLAIFDYNKKFSKKNFKCYESLKKVNTSNELDNLILDYIKNH